MGLHVLVQLQITGAEARISHAIKLWACPGQAVQSFLAWFRNAEDHAGAGWCYSVLAYGMVSNLSACMQILHATTCSFHAFKTFARMLTDAGIVKLVHTALGGT